MQNAVCVVGSKSVAAYLELLPTATLKKKKVEKTVKSIIAIFDNLSMIIMPFLLLKHVSKIIKLQEGGAAVVEAANDSFRPFAHFIVL